MTKSEYLQLLLDTSANGGFPAREYSPTTGTSHCQYRCKDGKKCPVGLLIPDNKYQGSFETLSVDDIVNVDTVVDVPYGMNLDDLAIIQMIHDSQGQMWSHEDFVKEITHCLNEGLPYERN